MSHITIYIYSNKNIKVKNPRRICTKLLTVFDSKWWDAFYFLLLQIFINVNVLYSPTHTHTPSSLSVFKCFSPIILSFSKWLHCLLNKTKQQSAAVTPSFPWPPKPHPQVYAPKYVWGSPPPPFLMDSHCPHHMAAPEVFWNVFRNKFLPFLKSLCSKYN